MLCWSLPSLHTGSGEFKTIGSITYAYTNEDSSLAEESPDLLCKNKRIIGSSVGLVSAAAISSFSNLSSFLPLAIEHVKVAFRLGVQVDSVSERISSTKVGKASWSKIASGVTEEAVEEILTSFHRQSVRILPFVWL